MKPPSIFEPFDFDAYTARLIEQHEQFLEEQFQKMELDLAFQELKADHDHTHL